MKTIASEMQTGHHGTFTKRNCALCASPNKKQLMTIDAAAFCNVNFAYIDSAWDKLGFEKESAFPIVQCTDCGFIFSEYLLDDKSLNLVYEEIISPSLCKEYSLSKVCFDINRRNFKKVHALLNKENCATCLDFGAGWGTWSYVADEFFQETISFEMSAIRKAHQIAYLRILMS
ncbi:MAG: hypothetical protein HRT89_16195 [Lentisphaeria bacterium]|nr:hypothetical protein [Lentisphaeria bacterium]NQZ69600.1 hypothetical protein [Lentisphaeria bacterium]